MDAEMRNYEICPPDRFTEEDFQAFEKQYMEDYKDEIVSPYDRHAGLVDGMKWQKEKDLKGALMEPSSEGLEKAAIDYGNRTTWTDDDPFNWILEIAFKDGANWQKEQIAARDKTLDYYTFENGEKQFARYILDMIANGWHINAVKSACEKKVEKEHLPNGGSSEKETTRHPNHLRGDSRRVGCRD